MAITRAKKHVVILTAGEESDGKNLSSLRFLGELGAENIAHTAVPRRIALDSTRVVRPSSDQYRELMVSEAKHVLLSSGLSVTALNHFLECPSKFLYESVLKLPQAPHVSAEKGNAMHEAISRVWMTSDHSEERIAETLSQGISDYFEKSFLSSREKDILKKELLENAPIVAKALHGHFNMPGAISTESFVRSVFDGAFSGQQVSIPIHGKLDAVVRLNDEVSVFDYKTRQAMSVAAIKGETKNSDGNYFNQLVFYTLLLRRDSRPTERIVASLVFVSPDEKGRCPAISIPVEEKDVSELKVKIQSLIDSVWSGSLATDFCEDEACRYCAYRKLVS